MSKTYPSEVAFILCDDVIEEAKTKKLTIVGYYIGDGILLDSGEKPGKALGQIMLVAKFRGGAGEYNVGIKLFDPQNKEIASSNVKQTKVMNENLLVGIKVSPFKINEFGNFKCIISLDNNTYEYAFDVKTR